MKKKRSNHKLRLSRETMQSLDKAESKKVAGGNTSCQSQCVESGCPETGCSNGSVIETCATTC